jgi:hypothetical protein
VDKGRFFDRNLLALSRKNPDLCSRLSGAETTRKRYQFLESRSGEVIPAWVDPGGTAHPLHSIMDPAKEAKRLIDTVENESFLILLGLGGGFFAEAALKRNDLGLVLVIEYGIDGLAELLCHRDYAGLFGDPRFHLIAADDDGELERYILNLYQPVLYGGIRVIPLRPRTMADANSFTRAGDTINSAIERVSADYSVQAHFGKRWFSNIIRNLNFAGEFQDALPPVSRAAITAAGPSLSLQIDRLKEKRNDFFLIAVDTSLPCLLYSGIKPDAVISVDCQHISYYHFMDGLPGDVLLFLDLASPPLLASRAKSKWFFSGGHPLTRYISGIWKTLPEIDTSGGNVTYAAVSLAERLGASEIELYGADFSYPNGVTYARGAYIYPYFAKRQNRFLAMEAQASAFLFRTPLEKITGIDMYSDTSWYYETKALKFYRERLEEKSGEMEASLVPAKGMGAPLSINVRRNEKNKRSLNIFSSGKALTNARDFLCRYRDEISTLPEPGENLAEYRASLKGEAGVVFTTMLPTAAALKRRFPHGGFREVFSETRAYCLGEIRNITN